MQIYAFSLCLGGAGLVAMAAVGFYGQAHGGARPPGGTGHGAGHPGSHVTNAAQGLRGAVGARGGRGAIGARGAGRVALSRGRVGEAWIWSLFSPRVAFSVMIGFGAAGLIARGWLPPTLVALIALLGGVLFERLLVLPFWNFLLRFASHPALTLESAVMDRATAVSGFDANGHGLVAIELDGQVVQVLGTLTAGDRASGLRIRAGDTVRVEEVDAARNRCTVSRLRA